VSRRGNLGTDPYFVGISATDAWDDLRTPRGPGHRLPKVRWSEVAERLRKGEAMAEVAKSVQRTPHTVACELRDRGWTIQGEVRPVSEGPSTPVPGSGPGGRGLRLVEPAPDFRDAGACASVDPAIFYPEYGDSSTRGFTAKAKKVCAACPVVTQCLQYALENDEPHGVWGGTTPYERQRMKGRGRKRKAS
jgi:WhiB family redox-sensing transcriptional regulator